MNTNHIADDILARARNIRLLLLDVDGVLSDGKLYFTNSGDEIKCFNSLDGQGIKMLQASGIETGIITGRNSEIVKQRAHHLGMRYVIQGREDKLNALHEILAQTTYTLDEIAYMGDDLPDLPLVTRVGLGMTVSQGHWALKQHAHWQSQFHGGEGAVREACDIIMLAQGTLTAQLDTYLQG
ncbi:MAG: 3-deoxy-manno-octulosonate-8-phosphatase KdsC [Cellvibrionaceae bacterium]|nr:3-deoxy-manno-octulosonate-8-phosphatase KdsC [Cellvibrionaceae bacterium]